MGLTPEVMMWIIGGLVVGLWTLLMWRMGTQDKARLELRDGMIKFFDKFEAHTKDDAEAFKEVSANMNRNHIELLGMLGSRRGDR
jgi:hypothetical protein